MLMKNLIYVSLSVLYVLVFTNKQTAEFVSHNVQLILFRHLSMMLAIHVYTGITVKVDVPHHIMGIHWIKCAQQDALQDILQKTVQECALLIVKWV